MKQVNDILNVLLNDIFSDCSSLCHQLPNELEVALYDDCPNDDPSVFGGSVSYSRIQVRYLLRCPWLQGFHCSP